MILPDFTYLAPSTLAEASKLAKEYDGKCKLMAGGTDIIVAMKEHVIAPEYIIDIKEIPGLDYLDHDPEQGLRIGALTKLRTIEKSLLVQEKFQAVSDAAHYVASTQVRSKGTMVGNLVNASPSADTVTKIRIPALKENQKAAYIKLAVRKAMDLAIVGVAAVITMDGDVCTDAKSALGAVAINAIRDPKAEEILTGQKLTDELIEKAAVAVMESAV